MPALLEANCSGSPCHQGTPGSPPAGGVDFFDESFPEGLVGLSAEYPRVSDPENCPTVPELIVDPDEPDASLVLLKVRGQQSCGDGMPLPYPALELSAPEIACLERWVDELALQAPDGAGGRGGSSSAEGM